MIYHHKTTMRAACGCHLEAYLELPEGVEPDGDTVLSALLNAINTPHALVLFSDGHVERGQESIDIQIRTKVGPVDTSELEEL